MLLPQNNDQSDTGSSSNSSPEQKLDKYLIEAGGLGRFQVLAYLIIGLGMNCTGFYFYMLGYFIQSPVYNCVFNDPQPTDPSAVCTSENICSNDAQISSWSIDYNNELTLYNWQ